MWDSPGDYQAYRNQVFLATAGNDYGPQFGPANPPSYYYVPQILECGCSEEDCNGTDCGFIPTDFRDLPDDYYFWQGTTAERERELQ